MYVRLKDISGMYSISKRHAVTLADEFASECHGGRYQDRDIIRQPKVTLLDADAFQDFMINRQKLKNKSTRRFLTPFKR